MSPVAKAILYLYLPSIPARISWLCTGSPTHRTATSPHARRASTASARSCSPTTCARGRYERAHRGLYRLRDYPGSSHEDVRAKWLTVGSDRAVVAHESALELHGLSDVLPNTVHLLVSRSDRGLNPPEGTTLHTTKARLGRSEVVIREGMRVTAPARSITNAAAAGTAPEQIKIAVRQALEQGLPPRRSLLASAERGGGWVAQLIRLAVREAGRCQGRLKSRLVSPVES